MEYPSVIMNEIEIEIPSHFLCPISMQLMKDPVTISTGITYDRESIEKWLFISCNKKVCPVTKQELAASSSPELTPNHTLRRLIQSWCTINASNGIERIPTPKPPVTKSQILKLINEAKKNSCSSSYSSSNNLNKLGSIAREGNDCDKKCLVSAGVVEFLVSIIIKKYGGDSSDSDWEINHDQDQQSNFNEDALNILYHLVVDVPETVGKIINDENGTIFTGSLMQILKWGNYRSRAYAIMVLNSIFSVANYPHMQLIVGAKPDYFIEIVSILSDQISEKATKSALKLLMNLCPWGRNRIRAVEAGAVWVLIQLLLEITDRRTNELILTVLDQLCRCAEGRAELLNHSAGLAIVSKKIFRVSHGASERSVRILSSIAKYSASPKILQEMLQVGVVAKLCLVLQLERNPKTIEKTKQILNLHSRVWKDSPCIPFSLISFYPSS